MSRRTGMHLANGQPHIQPRLWRRAWCVITHGGHMRKFGAWPRGSCVWCHWLPDLPVPWPPVMDNPDT